MNHRTDVGSPGSPLIGFETQKPDLGVWRDLWDEGFPEQGIRHQKSWVEVLTYLGLVVSTNTSFL